MPSSRRKPLILRGARQVGKTYSLTRFGEKYFQSIARIDLERNPDWHQVFQGDLNPGRIIADLEILLGAGFPIKKFAIDHSFHND